MYGDATSTEKQIFGACGKKGAVISGFGKIMTKYDAVFLLTHANRLLTNAVFH